MTCDKGYAWCHAEFRVPVDWMQKAYVRSTELDIEHSPYGRPVYPYVWRCDKSKQTITLEMGYSESGERKKAVFVFEPQAQGVKVHVGVWIVENPRFEGWSAQHSVDTRFHNEAIVHFKAVLLGDQRIEPIRPTIIEQDNVPPPDEEDLPPPPPPDALGTGQ